MGKKTSKVVTLIFAQALKGNPNNSDNTKQLIDFTLIKYDIIN
jgi:hypothetical protein